MSIFVVDSEGTPLLPTNGARARILLKQSKAKVYSVIPFTIQLNKKVDNPVGEFKVGVEDNPTKTCNEKGGFKHWDIIKANHTRLGVVIGSVRSLKKNCITLRTKFDNNFPVSYRKSVLLWKPSSIVYC